MGWRTAASIPPRSLVQPLLPVLLFSSPRVLSTQCWHNYFRETFFGICGFGNCSANERLLQFIGLSSHEHWAIGHCSKKAIFPLMCHKSIFQFARNNLKSISDSSSGRVRWSHLPPGEIITGVLDYTSTEHITELRIGRWEIGYYIEEND